MSADSGRTWIAVGTGLHNVPIVSLTHIGNSLYPGASLARVYHSTNMSSNWEIDTNGLASAYVTCLTSIGTTLITGSERSCVFVSTDAGADWISRSAGLVSSFQIVILSLQSEGSTIFAGTYGGFFYSRGTGISWHDMSNDLPPHSQVVAITATDGALYVRTSGFGLWKDPLSTVSVQSHEQLISSLHNYPNPFSRSTSLAFTLRASEQVHLDIYDVLGRKLKTLMNAEMTRGSHSVRFDGSGLAGGIYTVRLTSKHSMEAIQSALDK